MHGHSAPQRQTAADIPPQIAEQAVTWLVDLQAAAPDSTLFQEFMHWRQADPAHERAWQHIETVNIRLKGLASPFGSAISQAALAAPRSNQRRQAVKFLALALFAGTTTLGMQQLSWQGWLADVSTRSGERRRLTLGDGTQLALNSDSAVNIAFTPSERRLTLVHGEMLVTTGSDGEAAHHRPFIVSTRDGRLTPLGTRFAVRVHDTYTRLEVYEGMVEVHTNGNTVPPRIVHAGHGIDFNPDRIGERDLADENRVAWQDGMLVASRMRLADFLDELSRHRTGYLSCDPRIADLRLTGTYPLDDPERILNALRTTLPVDIHYFTRYWISVRPARGGA